MNLTNFARCAAVIGAALLTACGAESQSSGGSLPQSSNTGHRLNHHKSWILPNAGRQWLLYVSDEDTGTIDIYNYRAKAGKLYGQITGLEEPAGQCIDSAGNVYVPDYRSTQIYEFAHGGITPIATVSDIYGRPIGCSVDPTTGNVAVMNFFTPPTYAGNVVVFAGGLNGSQTDYASPELQSINPGAYDARGNLIVEGDNTASTEPVLAELPAGGSTFTILTGLTIWQTASVQWDGSYIAAVDQDYQASGTTAIHRVTISGSQVSVVRTSVLTDSCAPSGDYMQAFQPFIGGTTRVQNAVVAGDLGCSNRLGFWNYANGGNPKRVIPADIAPAYPSGASVSPPAGAR